MDIRILTEEIAEQIAKMKFVDNILNFAWDNIEDEERIFAGIDMLKDAGVPMQKISFYILTGYNTTFEQDKYRCEAQRSRCLVFCDAVQTKQSTKLARWANKFKRWI